jgi:hypothetical protein
MIIKIYGAYQWKVEVQTTAEIESLKPNKFSHNAIKTLIQQVENRVNKALQNKTPNSEVKIFYSKLRATSGGPIYSTIRDRMQKAYALIFDITDCNPNVMLELGMALQMQAQNDYSAKVFLICRADKFESNLLPSDLSGYFLSCYSIHEKTLLVTFKDSNSLAMRITSDILEALTVPYIEDEEEMDSDAPF